MKRCGCCVPAAACGSDRKSTRLNSSHTVISYAVFCLKKKKKKQGTGGPRLLHTPHQSCFAYIIVLLICITYLRVVPDRASLHHCASAEFDTSSEASV